MRIRTPLFLAAAGLAGYATWRYGIRPWWASWGFDPVEAGAPLPGDDLVPAPDHIETRGIDIASPPEAVWPWLVQMGYGRGGWYSYDRIDMEGGSATSIRPELQTLAVGDLVPTHPDGGLVVREMDPPRALVLYFDDEMIAEQAKAARATGSEETPANLQASGAFLSTAVGPRFMASWTYVLEPKPIGTRLVTRFRIAMPEAGGGSRIAASAMGIGVFLMLRKQLLGLRDRAEALGGAAERPLAEAPGSTPAPTPEPSFGAASDAPQESLATSPA